MAIIIAYDDSDGWYDHVMPPVVNESQTAYDFMTVPGESGTNLPLGGYQARYSFGPRMPLIIISPFAKENYVDHSVTDQSSIVRFIEDNWTSEESETLPLTSTPGACSRCSILSCGGHENRDARHLILDPKTGQPVDDQGVRRLRLF